MSEPHPYEMGPSVESGREWLLEALAKTDGPIIIFTHYSQYEGDIREWIKERCQPNV